MQGRLSKITDHGYQAFPEASWEQEFYLAQSLGLDHIEWVVDTATLESNELISDPLGVKKVINETGVSVISICADFLMDVDLRIDGVILETLLALSKSMVAIGADIMVVPCVDQSSLRSKEAMQKFVEMNKVLSSISQDFGIQMSIEADLPPAEFRDAIAPLKPSQFGVNYDIGNSAYLGYQPAAELASYGERMNLIHIKDRLRGGASVPLGEGDARVINTISLISASGYSGPYTMQAYRDDEGLEIFVAQLSWLRANLPVGGC
jgi:L-ribulose-5-phosphate 3-epimerase